MLDNDAVTIRRLDESSAPGVCDLYRKIYGEDFPFPGVYDPQALVDANREGRQVNLVAFDGDRVAGQAVTARSPWNPRLYEMVGLMVLPEARSGGVGKLLARKLLEEIFPSLDWAARYTESTTGHVNSQKVDLMMGHVHSALALDILPPRIFSHDGVFGAQGRGSCILSFTEKLDPPARTSFLPGRYAGAIRVLARDFRERCFEEDRMPLAGETVLQVISFHDAGTAYVPVNRLGADLGIRLEAALSDIADMPSVQMQLPLVPGVSAAVEMARERNFFFGGFLPHWFPEADGILLQRTASMPDWESIQVLPGRGEKLLEKVLLDRETLR